MWGSRLGALGEGSAGYGSEAGDMEGCDAPLTRVCMINPFSLSRSDLLR